MTPFFIACGIAAVLFAYKYGLDVGHKRGWDAHELDVHYKQLHAKEKQK